MPHGWTLLAAAMTGVGTQAGSGAYCCPGCWPSAAAPVVMTMPPAAAAPWMAPGAAAGMGGMGGATGMGGAAGMGGMGGATGMGGGAMGGMGAGGMGYAPGGMAFMAGMLGGNSAAAKWINKQRKSTEQARENSHQRMDSKQPRTLKRWQPPPTPTDGHSEMFTSSRGSL
eukprot:GHVT01066759.1.p1 GENE.GHVT01066759.1~~GHVT01066759.1.p1  ORF type:complete len:170 (+),score=36.42 GHVT01066759.1:337-846(+)